MSSVEELMNDGDEIDIDETPIEESKILTGVKHIGDKNKRKGKVDEPILRTITRPHPSFSQRLKMK